MQMAPYTRPQLVALVFQEETPHMEIVRYKCEHEDDVIAAIKQDSNWGMFTQAGAIDIYKRRLRESITYVCYEGEKFCGYMRALLDDGIAIYISELFVVPEMRNRKIGSALISRVGNDFGNLTVYALSDEDVYYEKLCYEKVGSVFRIHE